MRINVFFNHFLCLNRRFIIGFAVYVCSRTQRVLTRVNVFSNDYIEVSVPGTRAFFMRNIKKLRPSLTMYFLGRDDVIQNFVI